jgi:hypothetical protein
MFLVKSITAALHIGAEVRHGAPSYAVGYGEEHWPTVPASAVATPLSSVVVAEGDPRGRVHQPV